MTNRASRELGIEIIDGIDSFQKFRLEEFEIQDAQALATANPILLFVSAPYGLFQILDWISQAQLVCAVELEKIVEFRKIGIRTITDLVSITKTKDGKELVGKILFPTANNPEVLIDTFIAMLRRQIQFSRLVDIESFVRDPAEWYHTYHASAMRADRQDEGYC